MIKKHFTESEKLALAGLVRFLELYKPKFPRLNHIAEYLFDDITTYAIQTYAIQYEKKYCRRDVVFRSSSPYNPYLIKVVLSGLQTRARAKGSKIVWETEWQIKKITIADRVLFFTWKVWEYEGDFRYYPKVAAELKKDYEVYAENFGQVLSQI